MEIQWCSAKRLAVVISACYQSFKSGWTQFSPITQEYIFSLRVIYSVESRHNESCYDLWIIQNNHHIVSGQASRFRSSSKTNNVYLTSMALGGGNGNLKIDGPKVCLLKTRLH